MDVFSRLALLFWLSNSASSSRARSFVRPFFSAASKAFMHVMGPEGTAGVKHPADVHGRHEAGFTESEVRVAIDLQRKPVR